MFRTSLMFLAFGLGSAAYAQDPDASKNDTMSADELRDLAATARETFSSNAAAINLIANSARSANDSELLACVTPQATAAQALVNVGEDSEGVIVSAIESNDASKMVNAQAKARLLTVMVGKSNEFLAKAKQCQDSEGQGKTGSFVEVSGGFGDDSDTVDNDGLDEFDINVNPPQISPFAP